MKRNERAPQRGGRSIGSGWSRAVSSLMGVAVLATLTSAAGAAPPPREEIDRDLAGPFRAAAAQPATAHRGPLMRRLEPLLMQQARYIAGALKPLPAVPGAATFVEKKVSLEAGIRPDSHVALGLAILCRVAPDEAFAAGPSREQARAHALSLIRGNLWTHGAGGVPCADGKLWRNQWQSALWAFTTGEACWLLWDELTPEERWLAARMICDEADRFLNLKPPAQLTIDTKAEENAWNSMVISLAHCMFPGHPNAPAWGEAAKRWAISGYMRPADVGNDRLVDGKPLREWADAANIYDDFTLENHDRVHPDYMSTTIMLHYQVPLYTWAGKRPPEALRFNVDGVYASSKKLAFPDGGWIYPGGQDWHLHRNIDWIQHHAAAGVLSGDPHAAALLRIGLRTFEKMAARAAPDGAALLPEEFRFPSSQSMILEWNAQAYLLMAQFGEGADPVDEPALWRALAGKHVFESGKFALLRTENSIATFSWGRQVMGMALPLRDDLLLAPNTRGLIGQVAFPGEKGDPAVVQRVEVSPDPERLGVAGIIARGGGKLEQRFGFLALPDGRTIYADVLSLTGADRPSGLSLGTLGVLNDVNWPYHDGARTLTYATGARTFAAADARKGAPVTLASPWYHLDGLGICVLGTSGEQLYSPVPTPAMGRLEQPFHLNRMSAERIAAADASGPIAHGLFVFYPNQSVEQTRAAAERCRLLSKPGDRTVRLQLDDGAKVTIDLERLAISVE